jgi:hypothetical protein
MPASAKPKSETARLLMRAAKELERTGARTPGAIRKTVASVVRADIGHLTGRQQKAYVHSVAMGFDDALLTPSRATTFVNPHQKKAPVILRGATPASRAGTRLPLEAAQQPGKRTTSAQSETAQVARDAVFSEAMAARAKLAKEGKLLESGQFQSASGVSRQAIHQQTRTGSLFSVDGPQGVSYYPAFFVDTKYDRSAVRRVARAIKDLPGGSKWVFFTTPRLSLGGLTPLEVLSGARPKRRAGEEGIASKIDVSAVLRAAVAYAEE